MRQMSVRELGSRLADGSEPPNAALL